MHNIFKFIAFCLVTFLVSSCVSLNFEILNLKEQKIMSSPDLGSTSTRRLGDTLLSKAIATFGPAYQIEKGARVGKARTDELNNRMALVGQQEDYLYDQTREDIVTTKRPDEDL